MRIIFLLVALLFVLGIFAYIVRASFRVKKILCPRIPDKVIRVAAGLMGVLIVFSNLFAASLPAFVRKANAYGFALLLISFVILLILEILLFPVRLSKYKLLLYQKFVAGTALFAIIFTLFFGVFQAENIEIKEYHLSIKENTSLQSLRVVHLSDLHLGTIQDAAWLGNLVDKTNHLKPDMVLITGDLFDGDMQVLENPDTVGELLSSFETKYGTFLCWGNHDAGETFPQMREMVEGAGIVILEDGAQIVGDKLFAIGGRRDSGPIGEQGREREAVEARWSEQLENIPFIVMDHRPSNIEEYGDYVDLILSGHTHQGQVFPGSLVTDMIFPVDYGFYEKENGTQVIVSSGVGTWGPPIRLGTRSEIVLIEISFDS